jgi:hypothetical protein
MLDALKVQPRFGRFRGRSFIATTPTKPLSGQKRGPWRTLSMESIHDPD